MLDPAGLSGLDVERVMQEPPKIKVTIQPSREEQEQTMRDLAEGKDPMSTPLAQESRIGASDTSEQDDEATMTAMRERALGASLRNRDQDNDLDVRNDSDVLPK